MIGVRWLVIVAYRLIACVGALRLTVYSSSDQENNRLAAVKCV